MKSSYAQKLRDPRWQKKRLKIFERDQFACRDCDATDLPLHVHHCFYDKDPWETDDSLLLTLCADCHSIRQGIEDRGRRAFGKICASLPCRPDEQDLESFVISAENIASSCPDEVAPVVDCEYRIGIEEDGRWFSAAWHNPEWRPFYEKVTGFKPSWGEK